MYGIFRVAVYIMDIVKYKTQEEFMNKIQWGFSTIGCPDLSLKEAADLGNQAGYPLVEVRISNENFAEKDVLKKLAQEGRCRILGSSFGLINKIDDSLAKLKYTCLLASECGVPFVRIFGGCAFSEGIDEQKYENAVYNLKCFHEWNLPVRLVLETHDCFSTGKRIAALFERLKIHLPVIWDTYHTYFAGSETLRESWSILSKDIIDVHVKDGSLAGLTLPGKGEFPLEELFKLLKAENYSGMVTCEHEKMWHKELPELSEAFAALEPFRKFLQ